MPVLFCKELLKYQSLAEKMLPYKADLLTPKEAWVVYLQERRLSWKIF